MDMNSFPSIDLKATGERITSLRKERGLSVRDLQDYFGFEAPQAIYKWQTGASLPTVDNLLALSVLMEVPMESILVTRNKKQLVLKSKEPEGSFLIGGMHKGHAGETRPLRSPHDFEELKKSVRSGTPFLSL